MAHKIYVRRIYVEYQTKIPKNSNLCIFKKEQSQLLDLNPIENLWNYVDSQIRTKNYKRFL
jgi:hypothetical protein